MRESLGIAHASPANAHQDAARSQKDTWPEPVNQPAFHRGYPGFKNQEKSCRGLNAYQAPIFVGSLERLHK